MSMSSYRGWSHYRPYIVGGVFVVVLFLGLMPNASPGRNVVHILKSPSNTTPRQAAANKTLGVSLFLAKTSHKGSVIDLPGSSRCF